MSRPISVTTELGPGSTPALGFKCLRSMNLKSGRKTSDIIRYFPISWIEWLGATLNYGLSGQSSSEYMMSQGIIVINHSELGYEPHLHGNPPAKCSTFTTIYFRILLSRVKSLKGSRNRVHLRNFNDHQVGTGKYMLTLYFF